MTGVEGGEDTSADGGETGTAVAETSLTLEVLQVSTSVPSASSLRLAIGIVMSARPLTEEDVIVGLATVVLVTGATALRLPPYQPLQPGNQPYRVLPQPCWAEVVEGVCGLTGDVAVEGGSATMTLGGKSA